MRHRHHQMMEEEEKERRGDKELTKEESQERQTAMADERGDRPRPSTSFDLLISLQTLKLPDMFTQLFFSLSHAPSSLSFSLPPNRPGFLILALPISPSSSFLLSPLCLFLLLPLTHLLVSSRLPNTNHLSNHLDIPHALDLFHSPNTLTNIVLIYFILAHSHVP